MLIAFLAAILSSGTSQSMFSYMHFPVPPTNSCNICYGTNDCFPLEQMMCKYYMETDHLLKDGDGMVEDEENPQIKEQVDTVLYSVVESAMKQSYGDCLPFISSYTDCTKETIFNCKTCSCNPFGKWNCTNFDSGTLNRNIDINHRVLVVVLNNLDNLQSLHRIKRSDHKVDNYDVIDNTDNETNEEILALLYGFKADAKSNNLTTVIDDSLITRHKSNGAVEYLKGTTLPLSNIPETDYLAFDDVLNDLSIDVKNNTRRKPPLGIHEKLSPNLDYISIEDDKNENVHKLFNREQNDTTAPTVENTPEVVIDLLDTVMLKDLTSNETDYSIINKFNNNNRDMDLNNNTIEEIAVNIMKRDTKSVLNETDTVNEETNSTYTAEEIQNNLLNPLNNIINDKQKEINVLIQIRENFINFINKYHNDDFEIDYAPDYLTNNTKTQLSIYKLEMEPQFEFEYDLRRNNPNVLNKYIYKLKRDIYEVLKDIVGIHKYTQVNKMPDDLKMLIRSMKLYVKNNGMFNDNKNTIREIDTSPRRHTNLNSNSIIDGILVIIKIIDKYMPLSNALAPLSHKAKKVMKRVIKSQYVDEFNEQPLRITDPNYNFTADLGSIGSNWQKFTNNITKSSIHNKLHAIKLLYYQLTVDIDKMNDALNVLNFAQNRRMIQIEEKFGDNILDKISEGLHSVNDKIENIIKLHKKNKSVNTLMKRQRKNTKKESFLKRLKAALKNSKRDIAKLFRRKGSKTDAKQIARDKLQNLNDKITGYEDTMKKWQDNLNIVPKREKRSNKLQRIKNRIKNILPKYLRGKVNPAIDAKWANKSKTKSMTSKQASFTTPITKAKN